MAILNIEAFCSFKQNSCKILKGSGMNVTCFARPCLHEVLLTFTICLLQFFFLFRSKQAVREVHSSLALNLQFFCETLVSWLNLRHCDWIYLCETKIWKSLQIVLANFFFGPPPFYIQFRVILKLVCLFHVLAWCRTISRHAKIHFHPSHGRIWLRNYQQGDPICVV